MSMTDKATTMDTYELVGVPAGSGLLTIPEAAELLRVPDSWLYANTKNGKFPCVRMGRYVRIRQADIEAWITSGGQGHDDVD